MQCISHIGPLTFGVVHQDTRTWMNTQVSQSAKSVLRLVHRTATIDTEQSESSDQPVESGDDSGFDAWLAVDQLTDQQRANR
jgi:hypothetical protein